MKQSIPEAACRLCNLLRGRGFSKDKPFRLGTPVHLCEYIDMPGTLSFYEPGVRAIWPSGRTVAILDGKDLTTRVFDTCTDYGDGNYIDTSWREDGLLALLSTVRSALPSHHDLVRELADCVPVGTLTLPAGTTVNLVGPDGGTEPYELLEVSREREQPVVRYRQRGRYFCDLGRDLPEEDLAEILKAVRVPVPVIA